MALTSLLWISISLWPARKREDERGSRGKREGKSKRKRLREIERKRERRPHLSGFSWTSDRCRTEGRETREKRRKMRKSERKG